MRTGVDPAVHEVYLLAFESDGPGYLVLERKGEAPPQLIAHDPDARTSLPLAAPGSTLARSVAAALTPWPERSGIIAALEASGAARLVSELGWLWAEPQADSELSVSDARARVSDAGAELTRGAHEVLLASLPDAVPTDRLWLWSPDRARLGLELGYAGTPAVRAVHVMRVAPARSRLLSVEAYALHEAGEFAAARALWEQAQTLDPTAGDVVYNLACASARLGDAARALEHLRDALALDRGRFRRLAERDANLTSLHERADFRALLTSSGD